MTNTNNVLRRLAVATALLSSIPSAHSADKAWSLVPYIGASQVSDQQPSILNADAINDGQLDIAVDAGFTAGLGLRYQYKQSAWATEFGWEYRSNDSSITTAGNTELPSGNYASNIFYINGRYALTNKKRLTPWVGGGLTWIQELDLDSEGADGERSFSGSGSVGYQLMAGLDYELSDSLYLTSDLRYTSFSGIDLNEEGGNGRIVNIDYQPITVGLGLGYRF